MKNPNRSQTGGDIEVEKDSKMIYYQIKSTSSPSLPKPDIIESIRLFSSIEAINEKKYNEYVLVSNANIRNIHRDDMVKRPFSYLDDEITSLMHFLYMDSRASVIDP